MKILIQRKWFVTLLILAVSTLAGNSLSDAGPPGFRSIKNIAKATHGAARKALKPSFKIRSKYAGAMTSAAFSHDRKLFATGSKNGAAQLWNSATGQRDKDLRDGSGPVLSVAFVPGGKFLAAGSHDGTARLWNLETGTKAADFRKHSGPVNSITAINDRFLVTAGDDGTAKLWDLTGTLVREFSEHRGPVLSLAVSQDGTRLITACKDGQIRIWNWKTGKFLISHKMRNAVLSVATDPSDRYLVAGLDNGRIKILDFAKGKEIWQSGKAHKGGVRSVSVSPDGTVLASGGNDNSASLWSLPGGNELHRFTGHEKAVNAVAFTPDGRYLLTASDDLTARFWNRNSEKEIVRLISMKSGWAVVSPEGYFDGTLDGDMEDRLDAVSWTANGQSFAIDGFLEGYYKPALVGRLMAGPETAKKTGKELPNISEEFHLPPKVSITSPGSGSEIQSHTADVTIEAADQGGGINEIRLFHNEKVLDDSKAKSVTNKKRKTKTYHASLTEGENIFRAVGFSNDRIESEPAEVIVSYKAVRKQPRPVLHIIAVGINQYENSDLNLDFSVPDARGVLEYFAVSHTGLFDKLIKYELFDHNATQGSIYNMLESLHEIPPQDTVVIYFAGHGETLEDNWYYIPHDMTDIEKDEAIMERGISSSMLQLHIAKVGARRIFLMMDACKSGAVLDIFSEYDDQRSFALLSRATGIHIAAAATKEQYAGELRKLGHGVFTYILLEALNGKADKEPLDGKISVQEILSYIRQEMPLIVKKYKIPRQKPVINSRGMDFAVARNK